MHVLIIEDDQRVSDVIQRGLREEGYQVTACTHGSDGLQRATQESHDIIILDLMLPDTDGLSVLSQLREQSIKTPVLLLTARDELADKVEGLNAGADDYLTKPFGFEELLARLRALLRRTGNLVNAVITVNDLKVDTLARKVSRNGEAIVLTNREYALLEYLARKPNQIITREELNEQLEDTAQKVSSNVIDVHIGHLRRKIDDNYAQKLLKTIRGKGYSLTVEESD